MATTAAVLNIMVAANTAPASAQLAALQAQLAKTETQSNRTSTTVGGGLSKGGKMAAVGLGAAAVAAIGVGKALTASIGAARSFESSFAEVRKTVDTNEAGFRRIERGLRNLAKQIPVPVEELNNLAGEAGALGIAAKDIVAFTRVASQLGTTTDMSSSDAANALARLSNIMGTSSNKFENLASALVGLGNAGASTESEIAAMALRIAATGKQVGLSEADVLGFASALSSVGIEAEAGGSAISRAFSMISEAVATGNEKLSGFAKVAEMSVPSFSRLFERDAAKAMLAFIKGLGDIQKNGGNALVELEKLGINEIRLRNALLSAAGAGDLFNKQLRISSSEFTANSALSEEAQKRYATFDSQVALLKNSLKDLGITIGLAVLPTLKDMVVAANNIVNSGFLKDALDESGSALGSFFNSIVKVGGAINDVAELTAKDDDSGGPTIFERIATGAPEALGVIQNFTGRLRGLRANQVKTADAAKAAEQRLNQMRRQHGPSSRQAIIAEAEYRQALQRSARAQRKLEQAQKLTGPVRRATINLVKEEVKNLKAEIQRRKNAIQVLGAQLALEDGKSAASKRRQLRLSELIKNAARQQAGAQGKLNQIIVDASAKIGPKFAKSLERIRASTQGFRNAIGNLKSPMNSFKGAASSAFDGAGKAVAGLAKTTERIKRKAKGDFDDLSNAAEKSSKRIRRSVTSIPGPVRSAYGLLASYANSAAQAFGSSQTVSLKFRRGGMAKFSGPGLVPAMVSPGELISYKGREVYVPGRPEPRDSVMMNLPAGAKVFTFDGQARMAMGASQNEALRKQAPHFATGGIVANAPKPRLVGGARVPRATGQSAIDRGRDQAIDWVKKLKPTLDMITRIARGFGLSMTSGYRPGDDGYHGINRARDYSNSSGPTPEMFKFGTYVADNYQRHLLELIYTPLGFGIKNGARTAPYAAADHYDHVHVAMRKGGLIPRFKKGGRVKASSPLRNKEKWTATQLHTLAAAVGMKNPGLMSQIAQAESGGNAKLNNAGLNPDGSIDYGLWQINSIHGKPVSGMLNPIMNAYYAKEILNSQGLGAWVAYTTGRHQGFDPGQYDHEFFFDLLYSSKAQKNALKSAKKARTRLAGLDKQNKELGTKASRALARRARKNVKAALKFARKGNVRAARKKTKAAHRLIKKAMKRRRPGGGGGGSGSSGGAAPGATDPTLPGMPTGNTLDDLRRAVAYLQEDADLFEEQAGLDWSPAGPEFDPTERATLISKNEALLAKLVKLRDKLVATINYWKDRVPKLRDKVKKAQGSIKDLRKKIKGSKNDKKIKGWQKQIKGHEKDIKGWQKGITQGTDLLGSLPDERDAIQGVTGRGGEIQRVQLFLEELGQPTSVNPTDPSGDSEIAELLRQQLQETQRALAISQAQMPIFQQFMPRFHQGGVVQGPMGAERPVMAQAGEGIFTRDQMRAMGSQNITVVIEDAAIDSNRIRVEVDGVIQDKVSTVRRQGSNRRFTTSR